ncbi:DNA mismatch repair protein Mlh3 isoform X2 [Scleropages formosus]|uniref:DNA mismatch repair protein Mlh3 isoform X2 n=1 Tax=Scleropages formosus TaxID=113540 RepID=UPI0010FA82C9|nr:DNA mismatch repair protein Mlh3 isoform X2 [Scleropages formosus]
MIKCLPGEVQAKLRSGVAMVSLQQCVEELLLNAIDAQASCVAVRLDLDGCKVQVLDNGLGMDRDDMERVGNRYFTSKCSTLEDLENLRFYGFRGEAIASIASLSTLMEISSRPKLSVKTFVKVFREGEALNVFEAETGRPSSGTTVVICNFFHGMPVRRKRMDPVLECERIRQRVEAISLMHPSVSFTLKKDCSGAMVVQIPKARDTYHRFTQIHGIGRAQKLGEVNFCHGQFQMSGYIGREGHYNNSFQFLFVNKRLVLKTPIHKLLNLLLKKVCSVSQLNGSSGVSHVLGSPKQRLGPELHGVYVINIECHYSEYDVCYEPAKTLIEFKDWDSVLFCVEEGVKKFLTTENLITEISPEDIQDGFGGPVNPCSAMPCITRECYEGKLLASKAVYRRFTDNPNKTEEVSSINERADYSRAIETDKSNVEAARTMEQKCQPASTSVPYVPGAVSSQTENWPELCNMDTSTDTSMLEPLKDNARCKEASHNVQFTDGDSPVSESENMHHNTNPEGVKDWENERFAIQKTETVDHTGCIELQLGSEGFIKHIIPQLHTTVLPKEQMPGWLRFHSSRPVPSQQLFPLSSTFNGRNFTAVKKCSGQTGALMSHTVKQLPSVADFEAKEKPFGATKRKLPFIAESSLSEVYGGGNSDLPAVKSKVFKVMPRARLSLPVQAGSLDRFRRIYGNQRETPVLSVETSNSQMALDVSAPQVGHTMAYTEQCLSSAEEDLLSAASPAWVQDTPVLLSNHTTLKHSSIQSWSSESSLAGKLSRLKNQQTEDKSRAFKQPLSGVPNRGCCDKDKLNQVNREEQATNELFPISSDVLDSNANYMETDFERRGDANSFSEIADAKSGNFCGPFCTTRDLSSPLFPVIEKDVSPAQSASEIKQDLPSGAEFCTVLNTFGAVGEPSGGEEAESRDWQEHFDTSVGKLSYVNRVTGMSKYEAPHVEDTQVYCVKDVTTMAVSVMSRNGFEYRCYPFQTELVLPFLPRSRAERVLSTGSDNTEAHQGASSLYSLYSDWENPVFVRPPEVALNVTSAQAEGLAVKIHSVLYPYRFTKDMISSMKVIDQVDKKFLVCLINTRDQGNTAGGDTEGNLLVLVDQHAAHERVRLESLVADSYEEDPEVPGQKQLCSSIVTPPLQVDITEEEQRLLRSCQPFLKGLGLEVTFVEVGEPRALVSKVPVCFVEKEANELRRGRPSVAKAVVEEYIREQFELLRSTGRVRGTLPLTVLKVLASQACHGAIKFNNHLSREECCRLVCALSACQLPFQCAHGRPSMVPLADLLHIDTQEPSKPNLGKLRKMYRTWKLFGNHKERHPL